MLVLTRYPNQSIIVQVGDTVVEFKILEKKGNCVSIGVNAPKNVIIDREEIYQKRISGKWETRPNKEEK